jgi:hypothetical protein
VIDAAGGSFTAPVRGARPVPKESIMTNPRSVVFLRRVLYVDALSSAGMGLFLVLGAAMLEGILSLPGALLREAGIVLLPFAAFVGWIASRPAIPRVAVWVVIALNALWVIDSVVLLLTGWVTPNPLGYAFVLGQAAVVAVLAELEYFGLRRSLAAV